MVSAYYKHRIFYDTAISIVVLFIHLLATRIPGNLFVRLDANSVTNLATNIFTTSASLLGFVLAASTFLVSHIQHNAFAILRQSKSAPELARLIASALWRLFGLTMLSFLLIISGPSIVAATLASVVFFTAWSALALAALTWIVVAILAVPTSDKA